MRKANEIEISMAKAILHAIELRENSYDHEAAEKASNENELERLKFEKDHPDRIFYNVINYNKFYKLSLEEACEKAANEGPGMALGRIIYLALEWWNDTIDWAKQILDETATTIPTLSHCQHGNIWTINPDGDEEIDCPLCEKFWEKNHLE